MMEFEKEVFGFYFKDQVSDRYILTFTGLKSL